MVSGDQLVQVSLAVVVGAFGTILLLEALA